MRALAEGVLFGAALSAMVGPVFILLIHTAITRGFWNGFLAGLGSLISDLTILILCYNGFRLVVGDLWLGLAGVFILFATGMSLILVAKEQHLSIADSESKTPLYGIVSFVQGFLINTFSPFVFVFWAGIAVMLNERFIATQNAYLFITGMCLSLGVSNVLKVSFPRKITSLLSPVVLQTISKVCGVVMIVFAAVLGIKLFW